MADNLFIMSGTIVYSVGVGLGVGLGVFFFSFKFECCFFFRMKKSGRMENCRVMKGNRWDLCTKWYN
jgi:hypothetical protein